MNDTLVSDLVALLRRSIDDPARPLPALAWRGGVPAPPAVVVELDELVRRARISGATDEELALSLGALMATVPGPAGRP